MPDPIFRLLPLGPAVSSAGVTVAPKSSPISFFRLACAYAGKRANTTHARVSTVLRTVSLRPFDIHLIRRREESYAWHRYCSVRKMDFRPRQPAELWNSSGGY